MGKRMIWLPAGRAGPHYPTGHTISGWLIPASRGDG